MLDAKHSWVKRIQVGSDEGQLLSPMGNYYEIANLKKLSAAEPMDTNFKQTWRKVSLCEWNSSFY